MVDTTEPGSSEPGSTESDAPASPAPEPHSPESGAPESGAPASESEDAVIPPSPWEDLGGFIRDQRTLTRLSLRKLAEQAGVSNPYLSQIERGLRKPSAEILQQIARALSISAESLYVRAGILDERTTAVDVEGEIRRDHTLSGDQRDALIQIYRSFRAEAAAAGGADLADGESAGDETR